MHILVTASGEIDQNYFVFRQGRRQLYRIGQRMARFKSRDDSLDPAAIVKGGKRLIVIDTDVSRPSTILQPGMFRSDPRIIETGRYGTGIDDLTILILKQISTVAMQNPRRAAVQRSGMMSRRDSLAGRFPLRPA